MVLFNHLRLTLLLINLAEAELLRLLVHLERLEVECLLGALDLVHSRKLNSLEGASGTRGLGD